MSSPTPFVMPADPLDKVMQVMLTTIMGGILMHGVYGYPQGEREERRIFLLCRDLFLMYMCGRERVCVCPALPSLSLLFSLSVLSYSHTLPSVHTLPPSPSLACARPARRPRLRQGAREEIPHCAGGLRGRGPHRQGRAHYRAHVGNWHRDGEGAYLQWRSCALDQVSPCKAVWRSWHSTRFVRWPYPDTEPPHPPLPPPHLRSSHSAGPTWSSHPATRPSSRRRKPSSRPGAQRMV
jgi:hypothetical protein